MGKPGRDIAVERALEHVYGYTVVNDLTARDLQVRFRPDGSVWYEVGRGKVFDTSAPIVRADGYLKAGDVIESEIERIGVRAERQ